MVTQSTVHKFIESEVKPKEAAIKKEYEAQLPRLKAMGQKLNEALGTKDSTVATAKLKLYMKSGESEFPITEELLSRVTKLLESIEKLPRVQSKEEFQEVEKVTISVSQLKSKIKTTFDHQKEAKDTVADAMARPVKDGSEFSADWALMQTAVDNHVANAQWRLDQTNQFVDKAKNAQADRDMAEVTVLLGHTNKFREGNPSHVAVEKQFKEFCAKTKANTGLSKGAKDQLDRELPGLRKSLDQAADAEAAIAVNYEKIAGLKLKPIDAKKAATALKLLPKYAAGLKTALENKDRKKLERELDALIVKMLGDNVDWKGRGKDMIATLKKANLF